MRISLSFFFKVKVTWCPPPYNTTIIKLEQSPEYENESKRNKYNILETTRGQFHKSLIACLKNCFAILNIPFWRQLLVNVLPNKAFLVLILVFSKSYLFNDL